MLPWKLKNNVKGTAFPLAHFHILNGNRYRHVLGVMEKFVLRSLYLIHILHSCHSKLFFAISYFSLPFIEIFF